MVKKKLLLASVVIAMVGTTACTTTTESDNGATKIGTVDSSSTDAAEDANSDDSETEEGADSAETEEGADNTETAEENAQTVYYVGDILMDGDTKIVYMASGVYEEESEYSQPEDGYQYIYLQFAFLNTSETDDASASYFDFEAYADNYEVEKYYGGDDDLSATLSAGRATTGCVYFTVPVDAEEIEVEYTTNYFTSDKITFVYEGDKDSGYVLEKNTNAADGAFVPGDIIEMGDLSITYVSCEEDSTYSEYYQPAEGYHYVTCTFEVENIGEDEEYFSYFDFDCYADGASCEQSYFRDDGISATLSSGRKASGTVTFLVPDDATVVEMEYLDNIWTSSRAVFTCEY